MQWLDLAVGDFAIQVEVKHGVEVGVEAEVVMKVETLAAAVNDVFALQDIADGLAASADVTGEEVEAVVALGRMAENVVVEKPEEEEEKWLEDYR